MGPRSQQQRPAVHASRLFLCAGRNMSHGIVTFACALDQVADVQSSLDESRMPVRTVLWVVRDRYNDQRIPAFSYQVLRIAKGMLYIHHEGEPGCALGIEGGVEVREMLNKQSATFQSSSSIAHDKCQRYAHHVNPRSE